MLRLRRDMLPALEEWPLFKRTEGGVIDFVHLHKVDGPFELEAPGNSFIACLSGYVCIDSGGFMFPLSDDVVAKTCEPASTIEKDDDEEDSDEGDDEL